MEKKRFFAAFLAACMLLMGMGTVAAPIIGSEDYISAYLAIYKDYLLGGGKFTKNELLDVIDCYFSEKNLDNCANKVGERSAVPIGYLIAKAGTVYCHSGWACANPGETCCAYNTDTGKYELYRCE